MNDWLLQHPKRRKEMADELIDSECGLDEPETWGDWEEDDQNEQVLCLFCKQQFKMGDVFFLHLLKQHQFDLKEHLTTFSLDTYGMVQFINYLRSCTLKGFSVEQIVEKLAKEGPSVFQQEEFLKPVLRDDPLLYAFDSDDEDENDIDETDTEETVEKQLAAPKQSQKQKSTVSLEQENAALKEQLLKYAEMVKHLVAADDETLPGVVPADNDTYYFDSYSHVGIHREMITDRVRTDGYRNAILNNPHLFKDKVVLDVGCGTGILSMFAAQAGAKQVIGIDCSEMGTIAKQIVKDNGFENTITILRGKVEELELPVDKVDVIISEWMGYCLLYESMLDTVLFARDKWLVQEGYLFPDKCSMFLQAAQDIQKRFSFWDQVYGFNMKAIKPKISVRDGFIEVVDSKAIISNRYCVKEIDIDVVTYDELDFESNFVLQIEQDSSLDGFVASFDIGFVRHCTKPEYFTTGVESAPTHWQQVFFHLEKPFKVKKGDQVNGTWWIRRNAENPRFMDVEIEYQMNANGECIKQKFRIH
jgi:protein arginine N-methyltransferase 3